MRARVARSLVLLALAGCTGGRDPETPPPPPLPPSPPIVAPAAPAEPPLPAQIDAFVRAEGEARRAALDRIGEELGAAGLVRTLDVVPAEPPERAWFELGSIFVRLRELADPRAADALVRWAEAAPRHPHWRGEAGMRLAEIGDLRGAKLLGERMKLSPDQVYDASHHWEIGEGGHLSRTDLPRVFAARVLADLAMIHLEAKAELLAAAEDAVLAWANDRPQPHANALRFLAAAGSKRGLPDLRAWAFPKDPLPKKGAQPPFPAVFEIAQSALRYIGMSKDEPSFKGLLEQLDRKTDRKLVITQQGLEAGTALLGMSLRALAYGAASGLAHWGDPRAQKSLVKLIEDETWHEEARSMACDALAWCADERGIAEVVKKVAKLASSKKPEQQVIAACYGATLSARGAKSVVPDLVALLSKPLHGWLGPLIARAIGAAGIDAAAEARLFALLKDPAVRRPAALAILLGGTKDAAARVMAAYAAFGEQEVSSLADTYYQALAVWYDAALESGAIFRWVENAEAAGGWAPKHFAARLEDLSYDNGPHSLTRVVMRHRLRHIAKSGQSAEKHGAVAMLAMMKERGTLAALAAEPGETGALAKARLPF